MKKIALVIFTLTLAHAMHLAGNKLYDLEFQGLNFIEEAKPWETDGDGLSDPAIKTTECLQDTVLGGSVFKGFAVWQKTYENLPSHLAVSLQVPIDK